MFTKNLLAFMYIEISTKAAFSDAFNTWLYADTTMRIMVFLTKYINWGLNFWTGLK